MKRLLSAILIALALCPLAAQAKFTPSAPKPAFEIELVNVVDP